MYISASMISNIVFGLFLAVIVGLFFYYVGLLRSVSGHIIAEFWSGTGERTYVLCKKKREMLIDEAGIEAKPDKDEKGNDIPIDMNNGKSQLVVEIEVPKKHIKMYPEMAHVGYYTRRDCVDKCSWPIGFAVHVPASICAWEIGSSEPLDPRALHSNLPITSSAGFASGIREHDILMQAGMMVDSMQSFMSDTAAKISQFAKGTKNTGTIIGLIVLGILVVASIAISFMVYSKLSGLGV